jgi:hypothetical protein
MRLAEDGARSMNGHHSRRTFAGAGGLAEPQVPVTERVDDTHDLQGRAITGKQTGVAGLCPRDARSYLYQCIRDQKPKNPPPTTATSFGSTIRSPQHWTSILRRIKNLM